MTIVDLSTPLRPVNETESNGGGGGGGGNDAFFQCFRFNWRRKSAGGVIDVQQGVGTL